MKKMMMFLAIGATVALLALPVAAFQECTQENKDAWYAEFLKIRTTDQPKAFELAKKYLACPATGEVTEAQQKIIDYLKKWNTAYDEGMSKITFTDELYNKKNYPKAYELGRGILAKEPENLKVLIDLGANGYVVAPLKNQQLNTESLDYARKALQLLESGKQPEDWKPLEGKDAAMAYLNFTVGTLTLEKEPANALKYLLKAAQFETPLKKSPFTYAYIAGAYETGAYAKQSEAYKQMYSGKDETPESKLALANINQLVDRMIDSYARAVALAGADPQFATQKTVWQESLSTWYKYRHDKSDAGMTELVATILTKPLPPEPTPLTSLPASTPATPAATPSTSGGTPTNGAATNGTAPNGSKGTTAPAGTNQPVTNQTATKPTTTPAATTSKPAGTAPANPKRPRNHR